MGLGIYYIVFRGGNMAIKIYDVTSAAVEESTDNEMVVLALFDNRYDAITIIKPVLVRDKEGVITDVKLEQFDPDGAERLYWMEKFGMMTEADFQSEVQQTETDRKKLYELLRKEFE
jgi:hypothetical protein